MRVYWLRSFACLLKMIEHFGQKCRSRQGYPMVETRRRSPRQIWFPQSRWNSFAIRISFRQALVEPLFWPSLAALPDTLPPGMSDYLKGAVDALVLRNPQDANELAAARQRLLADSSPCATIGANASQTAALFSWDRHAREIHRLLSDATAHRA